MFDVSKPGRSRPIGFIPVGWYPTSVRVTPDGKRCSSPTAKGSPHSPTFTGRSPGEEAGGHRDEYIAGLLRGSLSVIPICRRRRNSSSSCAAYTAQAYACSPLQADETAGRARCRWAIRFR